MSPKASVNTRASSACCTAQQPEDQTWLTTYSKRVGIDGHARLRHLKRPKRLELCTKNRTKYVPTSTPIVPKNESQRTTSKAGGGRGAHVMHGRSRVTVDPHIPTMPGRSTSDFHRAGRHCSRQARSAVRCWASRMQGELHPTRPAFEADFLAYG